METWVYLAGQQPGYAVLMGKVNNPRGTDPFMHYVMDIVPDGRLEFVGRIQDFGSGHGVRADPCGEVDHPARIFLVDRAGRIREIYSLAFFDERQAWLDIRALLRD